MKNQVKLIIWDLDETLWTGILDEGKVYLHSEIAKYIPLLNDRGVMNSVCSKNDFEKAKKQLCSFDLWDEMIMPRISWNPKGEMIADIIKTFQLRSANVLFIDDNPMNLKEAEFYNPGLMTFNIRDNSPSELLTQIIENSKPDGRKRFGDYKILERKSQERAVFSSNDSFLRQSNIHIILDNRCKQYVDRIEELINRTNQLNFTKHRLKGEELKQLLEGNNRNFVVFANDRFGDYGLIGFVSLSITTHSLNQFVFSCRTLNMGIEQYVWNKLGQPKLVVIGEVTTTLDPNKTIDWIHEDQSNEQSAEVVRDDQSLRESVLLLGGCDLSQISHFLSSRGHTSTHFNYASSKYLAEVHRDSVHFLFAARCLRAEQQQLILTDFPLAEPRIFECPDFSKYETIIYSPLIDYVQNVFAHNSNPEVQIAFGDHVLHHDEPGREARLLREAGVPEVLVERFCSRFSSIGAVTPDSFLSRMRDVFAGFRGRLIILSGAESLYPPGDAAYVPHHIALNLALRQYCSERSNSVMLNIDDFLRNQDDFVDSIRHYRREVYHQMAEHLMHQFPIFRRKNRIVSIFDRVKNVSAIVFLRFQVRLKRFFGRV